MKFRTDLEALILGILSQGAAHGYDIAKQIRGKSEDQLRFGEGQLYPVLHRLERNGSIRADWEPQEGRPNRKLYALTDQGVAELERRRREWSKFSQSVSNILSMEADR